MPLAELTQDIGSIEECIDEIGDFVIGMQRYSTTVLAVAMRVHLETLLQTLLAGKECTREEVRAFVREMGREALEYEEQR